MTVDVASLRILTYPAAPLREPARPIQSIDEEVKAVAARMFELTREHNGLGLAAPQVGLSWRMFVTVANDELEGPDRVFVNPRLELAGPLSVREEGCLSLPGIHVDIRRPEAAAIVALDLDGNEFRLESSDLAARVWQHEHDHIEGVLIIDKMSPMDRLATRKTLKELEAAATPATGL